MAGFVPGTVVRRVGDAGGLATLHSAGGSIARRRAVDPGTHSNPMSTIIRACDPLAGRPGHPCLCVSASLRLDFIAIGNGVGLKGGGIPESGQAK
jgi:hypothetical protein